MVINAKKFTKLKNKLEKNLIGSYGSDKGLGQDLIIKKYFYKKNKYGDQDPYFASQASCKGIVVIGSDLKIEELPRMKYGGSEVKLYIPVEYEVEDTETEHYEFIFNEKTYVLVKKNDIGQVANITGVVREITLKLA